MRSLILRKTKLHGCNSTIATGPSEIDLVKLDDDYMHSDWQVGNANLHALNQKQHHVQLRNSAHMINSETSVAYLLLRAFV